MKIRIYQVDAFTDKKQFSGNSAAVCPLESWMDDATLQNIAMENNLSETAFYVKDGDRYHIRWFTPETEVDLCGHATLASAYVLFNHEGFRGTNIHFYSHLSGDLRVRKDNDHLTLDFPADTIEQIPLSTELTDCFVVKPVEAYKGKTDYMFIFDDEAHIRTMQPHLDKLSKIRARGIIVTARGSQADFVSRFFAPQSGITEDPVTGSAHTTLTPYWAKVLGKNELRAAQLSARGGKLNCRFLGERVEISGKARHYMKGEIEVFN